MGFALVGVGLVVVPLVAGSPGSTEVKVGVGVGIGVGGDSVKVDFKDSAIDSILLPKVAPNRSSKA